MVNEIDNEMDNEMDSAIDNITKEEFSNNVICSTVVHPLIPL